MPPPTEPIDVQILREVQSTLEGIEGAPANTYFLDRFAQVLIGEPHFFQIQVFPTAFIVTLRERGLPEAPVPNFVTSFLPLSIFVAVRCRENAEIELRKIKHDVIKALHLADQLPNALNPTGLVVDCRYLGYAQDVFLADQPYFILEVQFEYQYRFNRTDPTLVG